MHYKVARYGLRVARFDQPAPKASRQKPVIRFLEIFLRFDIPCSIFDIPNLKNLSCLH